MTRVAAEAVGPAVEIVVGVVTVGVVRVVGCGTVRGGGVSKERQEIIRERLSCRWTLGAALESGQEEGSDIVVGLRFSVGGGSVALLGGRFLILEAAVVALAEMNAHVG